jgi:hypothetical protein
MSAELNIQSKQYKPQTASRTKRAIKTICDLRRDMEAGYPKWALEAAIAL